MKNDRSIDATSNCPSVFALERLRLGELHALALEPHVSGCAACGAQMETLAGPPPALDLDQVWMAAHPPRPLVLNANRAVRHWLGAAALAATVAIGALWIRRPETQTKGPPWSLSVIARTPDGQVTSVEPGATLHAGDRLRFQIATRWPHGQAALVSMDSRGSVSPLVPTSGDSIAVPYGRRVLLDQAVELDDAVGPERIVLVGCAQPIAVVAVVSAARQALARSAGDLNHVGSLDLGCHEEVFWINKVPR